MKEPPLISDRTATWARNRPRFGLRNALQVLALATAATLGPASCGFHSQSGVPPAQQAQAQANLLKYATCMRSNGITNYPEPIVNPKRGVGIPNNVTIPNTPTFQAAQNACKDAVPGLQPPPRPGSS